jgi:hypothetical protein
MKLQMKREVLEKIDRQANEVKGFDTVKVQMYGVLIRFEAERVVRNGCRNGKWSRMKRPANVGA